MNTFFLHLLNISISASWLIAALLLLRFIFVKMAPRWTVCLLWVLAGARLLMPFWPESPFSLQPAAQAIPADITVRQNPAIDAGVPAINDFVNSQILADLAIRPESRQRPVQTALSVSSVIWVCGLLAFLLYALYAYFSLKRKTAVSIPISQDVRIAEKIDSPFIFGIIKPVIYIPSGLDRKYLSFILLHEKAHIRRFDPLWKMLGFLLLSVYWFNPLVWLSYILFCRDIEEACDEQAIRDMGSNDRKNYSQALLACSSPRRKVAAFPLSFGEIGVKERIKHVLRYRKPGTWITIAAIAVCAAAAVCYFTSPQKFIKKPPQDTYFYADTQPGRQRLLSLSLDSSGRFTAWSAGEKVPLDQGTWKYSGHTLLLEGSASGSSAKYYFTVSGSKLLFDKKKSSDFAGTDLPDGTAFAFEEDVIRSDDRIRLVLNGISYNSRINSYEIILSAENRKNSTVSVSCPQITINGQVIAADSAGTIAAGETSDIPLRFSDQDAQNAGIMSIDDIKNAGFQLLVNFEGDSQQMEINNNWDVGEEK